MGNPEIPDGKSTVSRHSVFVYARNFHPDDSCKWRVNGTCEHPWPRYRKIPKISPGTYFFQRPFLRGFYSEGNLRFKIDWAILIVGSKFTIFALFYFVFEGNFPTTSLRGAYIWEGGGGRFNGGFFASPDWGAYTWRASFRNFTVFPRAKKTIHTTVGFI